MEKRARPRLKVSMPIQVIGRAIDNEKFREICQTQDASAFGLCFILQSTIKKGTILYISMRMPRRLRLFDLAKDIYQIYAQVQRVQMLAQGGCEVGVSFIGRNPPAGYENLQSLEYLSLNIKAINTSSAMKSPSGSFALPIPPTPLMGANLSESIAANNPKPVEVAKPPITPVVPVAPITPSTPIPPVNAASLESTPQSIPIQGANSLPNIPTTAKPEPKAADSRQEERHRIPIDATIEFLDDRGNAISSEAGLVTDISKNGACVMSTRETKVGTMVKIFMMRDNFTSMAEVRSITTSQGGVWNLHLKFIDKRWMGGS